MIETTETLDPSPDLPTLPSPYDGKKIGALTHLKMSVFWFGFNFIWGCFLGPVLSSEMTRLAPANAAQVLGLFSAMAVLPALIVPLLIGPLSDRCTHPWGRRRPYMVVGGGIALLGIAFMAFGYEGLNIFLYFAGYFTIQIGANIALGAYNGIIPDLVPHEQRGTSSGYYALMSQIGTLLGAFLSGQFLSAKLDWGLYVMMGGLFIVTTVIAFFGLREQRLPGPVPHLDWRKYLGSLWIDPRKYPDFAWVWITRALMMVGFYSIQPYILYYLRDVVHVREPESTASIVIGLILIAATISGFLGGAVSDRTGRKPIVVWASILIAAMCVLLVFCRNLEQVLAAGILFGLGYGAYVSVDWALGADVLPAQKDAGKDMAVWHIAMTLPQQIGPLLAGLILTANKAGQIVVDGEKVTTYGWMGYVIVFLFAAVCFFFSGILVRKVRGVK